MSVMQCRTGILTDMYDNHEQTFAFNNNIQDEDGFRAALGYARRLRGIKTHVTDEGVIPGTGEVILKTKPIDKGKGIPQMCIELHDLNFKFRMDDKSN